MFDELPGRTPDEVLNQPPPLQDYNLLAGDAPLVEALRREGGGWVEEQALEYGALLGRSETLRLGEMANRHVPELRTHDRFGQRIDEVEFHPAWHELMRLGIEQGCHCLPWTVTRPGAHVARATLSMLRHQVDEGSSCPLTMTFAALPSLRLQPELAAEWEARLLSQKYDPRFVPADGKDGALFGMAMTERQCGSDLRSITTRATPIGPVGPSEEYTLTGHKWFCSAPMCDAFLVLAQTEERLSCFLMPRWAPDGTRNRIHIMRLKDKLGNRSNASAELELQGAWARMLGEPGRGVANIIEMVRHTRLDCVWAAAASLRRALAEALHHAYHRHTFGKRLLDQPLMKNLLADLCLESEAASALALRLARSFDEAPDNIEQRRFARVATAIGKYWVTRRAIIAIAEALECLGGNGYVEEAPLARLYRDAPVNSIWEGAGNIQCLDVLRALEKDPRTVDVLVQELNLATGNNPLYDDFVSRLANDLREPHQTESNSRSLVARLGLALQAGILVQHAPDTVAKAFCASRLAGGAQIGFGTLPSRTDFDAIIQRSLPTRVD